MQGLPVLRALSLCTCCRHYPGAAAGHTRRSSPQPCQPSPEGSPGRPAHRPFRGLLGVHSRCGLHTREATNFVARYTEGFSHFVTSMTAPVASGWSGCRVGLAPTGKRRLSRRTPVAALCRNRIAYRRTRWSDLVELCRGGHRCLRADAKAEWSRC